MLMHFLPYEELKVKKTYSAWDHCFTLSTPWISFDIEMNLSSKEDEEDILKSINEGSYGDDPSKALKVSWFLDHFKSYPLSYILPGESLLKQDPIWFSDFDAADLSLNPSQLFKKILDTQNHVFSDLCESKVASNLLKRLPENWQWEADAVGAFAHGAENDHYDALTLFSIIRRFHLKNLSAHDESSGLYDLIKRYQVQNELSLFKDLTVQTLRQNHFVTAACSRALLPALERSSGKKRDEVAAFIDSERGHDLLLEKAITALDPRHAAQDLSVCESTFFLVCLLRYAATTNFIAFTCALDMFERDDYKAEDQLAQTIAAAGYKQSAFFLQKHKLINQSAQHDSMGIKLLLQQEEDHVERIGIEKPYLEMTIRLCELLSFMMNKVSSQILEHHFSKNTLF